LNSYNAYANANANAYIISARSGTGMFPS